MLLKTAEDAHAAGRLAEALDAPAGTTGQSVNDGLGYLWNPDFSKLGNFKTWLAAAGHAFLSDLIELLERGPAALILRSRCAFRA